MDRFPRWRVWWRAYYSTETTLSRLPVLLLLPTVAALVGTSWAASHPADDVRHGLVVHQTSFGGALVTAVIGGLVGLLGVVLLVFVGTLAWYRLRRDSAWKAEMEFHFQERPNGITSSGSSVRLVSTSKPPTEILTLGHVEAVLKAPSHSFLAVSKLAMGGGPTGIGFAPFLGGRPEAGTYEVRWYAMRQGRHLQEVTRAKVRFDGEQSVRTGR